MDLWVKTSQDNRQSQEMKGYTFGFTVAALLYRDSVLFGSAVSAASGLGCGQEPCFAG